MHTQTYPNTQFMHDYTWLQLRKAQVDPRHDLGRTVMRASNARTAYLLHESAMGPPQDSQGGGFAGAVWPEQPKALARADTETSSFGAGGEH